MRVLRTIEGCVKEPVERSNGPDLLELSARARHAVPLHFFVSFHASS